MDTVKLNPRQVANQQTGTVELQGNAKLLTIGSTVLEQVNTEGERKNYKIGTVSYDAGNGIEVQSAQIFEKTYAGNPEKGTEPVNVGDIVSLNISADENNTYFRVIGSGGGTGIQSKDVFANLLGSAKPSNVVATEEVEADAMQA